jgi:hypothetical protein
MTPQKDLGNEAQLIKEVPGARNFLRDGGT